MTFNIVDGGSTAALEISVSATLTNFSLGQSTTMTASASGGTAPYKYTFTYAPYGTSNWTTLVSNSSSPSYTYIPKSAGKCYLRATVIDAKGNTASDLLFLL